MLGGSSVVQTGVSCAGSPSTRACASREADFSVMLLSSDNCNQVTRLQSSSDQRHEQYGGQHTGSQQENVSNHQTRNMCTVAIMQLVLLEAFATLPGRGLQTLCNTPVIVRRQRVRRRCITIYKSIHKESLTKLFAQRAVILSSPRKQCSRHFMSQQQQVWLGLAGDLVGPSDVTDYYATKVGGCAVLPGSAPPAEVLSGCTCSVCGRPLSLLMQVSLVAVSC
jgi:hypothetical protein